MARAALRMKVPVKDQQDLRNLVRGGIQQVRVTLLALTLLRACGRHDSTANRQPA